MLQVLLAAVIAVGCSSRGQAPVVQEEKKPRTVTIVALSDFHGALEPRVLRTGTGEPVEVGGAALIATYLARIKETATGPVVLVDSGDMWQGTLVSNLEEGAPVVRFYNAIGLAAAALGNHEFDFGPKGVERDVPLSKDDDPRGALKARVEEAAFPLLGVNVRTTEGAMPDWVAPSVMVEEGGIKIGIVGGASRDTASTTVVANVVGLEFLPLPGPVEEEARRLRAAGADVVVAVVHAGGACSDNDDPDDLSSCSSGELFELVQSLPKGLVDVFVGGHSHAGVAKRVGGAAVIQPFAHGQFLGSATIWLDGSLPTEVVPPIRVCGSMVEGPAGPSCDPRHVRQSTGPVFPATFLGALIGPDEEIEALLASDIEAADALKRRPLGVTSVSVVGRAYGSESALGNLVADALRAAVPDSHAAFINGGGLRAELPAGELTYGDIFSSLPFDNRAAVLDLDGVTLRRIVEHGHTGGHSALSWSGLSFTAEDCAVGGIVVGGEPLKEDGTYRVVTNSYLAGGGSGFAKLGLDQDRISVLWDRPVLRGLVVSYLEEQSQPLVAESLYDPSSPRQTIEGACDR